jgi:hypothetical protein
MYCGQRFDGKLVQSQGAPYLAEHIAGVYERSYVDSVDQTGRETEKIFHSDFSQRFRQAITHEELVMGQVLNPKIRAIQGFFAEDDPSIALDAIHSIKWTARNAIIA